MNANDSTRLHLDKILKDPKAVFERPEDVLATQTLNAQEQRRVLEGWREDALALQRASEEAMSGGENDQLKQINDALAKLESKEKELEKDPSLSRAEIVTTIQNPGYSADDEKGKVKSILTKTAQKNAEQNDKRQ